MTPRRIRFLLISLATLLLVLILISLAGHIHPAFDSIAHFRAHLAALLALSGFALFALRGWLTGLAVMLCAFAAFTTVLDDYPLSRFGAVSAGSAAVEGRAVYRLLHVNVRYDNRSPEQVLSMIGRARPDVVTLNEVSAAWQAALERITAAYPHRLICPSGSRIGGVAILSRRPFAEGTSGTCVGNGFLAIAAVDFAGRPVDIAALHLPWPWPFEQSAALLAAEQPLAALSDTALLAGDFNAAGWSAAAWRVRKAGNFDAAPPVGATWLHRSLPSSWRRWVGLPIDHVLIKGNLAVHSARTLDDAGSDHLPVLVEFSVLSGGPPAERNTATASLDL